jgi:hypothetical protein
MRMPHSSSNNSRNASLPNHEPCHVRQRLWETSIVSKYDPDEQMNVSETSTG